jgi:hypothetical protein
MYNVGIAEENCPLLRVKRPNSRIVHFFENNEEFCFEKNADILVRNQILRFSQYFSTEKTNFRINYFEIGLFSIKIFALSIF